LIARAIKTGAVRDNGGGETGKQCVGTRSAGLLSHELEQRLDLRATDVFRAREQHAYAVLVRAWVNESPLAPQFAAAHQRVQMTQQRRAVAGTARVGMTQQLFHAESLAQLAPNEVYQPSRNRRIPRTVWLCNRRNEGIERARNCAAQNDGAKCLAKRAEIPVRDEFCQREPRFVESARDAGVADNRS
jgi:hypothetical protein